jgi:N-acetylneuraminate synthase
MLEIAGRPIGDDYPCYITAEIGLNANGDIQLAEKLIDVAVNAGCDAVKFQKRHLDACIPEWIRPRRKETPWGEMSYMDYKRRLEFYQDDYDTIDWYCHDKGITWFASAWDIPSFYFLEEYGVPCHKVASAMATHKELVGRMIHSNKPIIFSLGGVTAEEFKEIREWFPKFYPVIWTHCIAIYPCDDEYLNLRYLRSLKFWANDAAIGYSGHERGIATSVAAAVMGANYVERHITLDRAMWGSDQAASLEPEGIRRLVRDVRAVEAAYGNGSKQVLAEEAQKIASMRYW